MANSLASKLKNGTMSRRDFARIMGLGAITLASGIMIPGCDINVTNSTPDEITIDPAHTGMITGRVLGTKIENNNIFFEGFYDVKVRVFGNEETGMVGETTTNYEGYYSIDDIPAGSYMVHADPYFQGPTDSAPVTVTKQQTAEVRDLKIIKIPCIEGYVKNEDGSPFGEKFIKIKKGTERLSGFAIDSTTTNQDGKYAMERWDGGSSGYADDFVMYNGEFRLIFNDNNQESISLVNGYTIEERDLTAIPL